MRGDLSETSVGDACRELARTAATGMLDLDSPSGRGRVVLADGRVAGALSPAPRARVGDRLVAAGVLGADELAGAVRVRRAGAGPAEVTAALLEEGLVTEATLRRLVADQVLDALLEMTAWHRGRFSFTPGPATPPGGVAVALPVEAALAEVDRRRREWAEVTRLVPDLDAVPVPRRDPAATAPRSPEQAMLHRAVDGVRSVRALAADLGYGEFEAARLVHALARVGLVTVRAPDPQPDGGEGAGDRTADRADARGGTDDDGLEAMLAALRHDPPGARFGTPETASDDDRPPVGDAPGEQPPSDDAAPTPPSARADDADVAEFLRELSRLTADDRPTRPPRPPAEGGPPHDAPRSRDADRGRPTPEPPRSRRRRGFFGRGDKG